MGANHDYLNAVGQPARPSSAELGCRPPRSSSGRRAPARLTGAE
ncbi:hypothetical protein [Saccharopolyspora gregorii]